MTSQPVCIITGGGRGIGEAAARALDARGYRLLLVSRSPSEVERVAASLQQARACIADVAGPGEAERVVAACQATFGQVDALVNNAGSAPLLPIEQTSDAIWEHTLATNLTATFRFTRAVWPVFRDQHHGVIVNISSLASRDPFAGFGAYAAAKAGINLFSNVAAKEGAADGIRVHVVAPGAVETQMLRSVISTDMLPADQTLAPQDVAQVIAACVCGDLRYTSGEVLYVHNQLK